MTEHFGNTKVRLNDENEEKSSAASGSRRVGLSWPISPQGFAHYTLTHAWGWPNPLHLIYDLSILLETSLARNIPSLSCT